MADTPATNNGNSTTEISGNDSVFSATWMDTSGDEYLKDFGNAQEVKDFNQMYDKILETLQTSDGGALPTDASGITWLAKSGYIGSSTYSAEGKQLIQGVNTFEAQNLDDTGMPDMSQQTLHDKYLLFKLGFYGSMTYKNIRSVIISAMEN